MREPLNEDALKLVVRDVIKFPRCANLGPLDPLATQNARLFGRDDRRAELAAFHRELGNCPTRILQPDCLLNRMISATFSFG